MAIMDTYKRGVDVPSRISDRHFNGLHTDHSTPSGKPSGNTRVVGTVRFRKGWITSEAGGDSYIERFITYSRWLMKEVNLQEPLVSENIYISSSSSIKENQYFRIALVIS